jgi:predicted ATP-dependent endonuclease of OLD family
MQFDVRDAKPEDPEGMRDGINVWGEVYDTVHWAHTPLRSRSRGFVWFFSFLAWYEDMKRKKENVILLLDEPGLSLHGRAQADLLVYFDAELPSHQLIYTTHSPFMIDPRKFDRVRIVQDLGIDAKEQLPKDHDGTKVLANVFDATDDSLFPLQGALGYEIHQTLFIGPNSLVVEGPADMLYLRAVSAQLEREGRVGLSEKWVITPVGGSGKVPTFVALLAPQKGMNVATLLDIQNSDRGLIEDLYKKKLLNKKQVATYADFVGQKEADVEDMFDRGFYMSLVNAEFAKQLTAPIDPAALNAKQPRTLQAIEAWLKKKPLKSGAFSHYRPARYFSENLGTLWPQVSDTTKDRFEAAFKHLNALL